MDPPKSVNKKTKRNMWVVTQQQAEDPTATAISNQLPVEKKESLYQNISFMGQKYTFKIESVLGSGFASTVYLGNNNATNQLVCIKAVDLMAFGSASQYITLIEQQIRFLQIFNSDYIVQLYDVYQSPTFYYLVMQLCPGGDLYKLIKMSPGPLPPSFITSIMLQIASGLLEIHEKEIIHRDLKTENIFILSFPQKEGDQMKVKIGDLGFCIQAQQLKKLKEEGKTIEDLGSPIYMSPEISTHKQYTLSSDIYAFGIIWYELFHKKAPWEALSEAELLQKKLTIKPEIWRQDMDPQVREMITKCISNEASQRPTCLQLRNFLRSQQEKQIQKGFE